MGEGEREMRGEGGGDGNEDQHALLLTRRTLQARY